jgi:hypothetical protein
MTDSLYEIERATRAWESWDAKPGSEWSAGAFEDAAQALAGSAGTGASALRATVSDLARSIAHGTHVERAGIIRQAIEGPTSCGH